MEIKRPDRDGQGSHFAFGKRRLLADRSRFSLKQAHSKRWHTTENGHGSNSEDGQGGDQYSHCFKDFASSHDFPSACPLAKFLVRERLYDVWVFRPVSSHRVQSLLVLRVRSQFAENRIFGIKVRSISDQN